MRWRGWRGSSSACRAASPLGISALARLAQQRRELLTKVCTTFWMPTAAMQGYLELLLLRHGSLDAAEQRNYLQTAARQSERLARLVGDLFQLAELDADDARLQGEDFVLAELVHDVVQQFGARRSGARSRCERCSCRHQKPWRRCRYMPICG